MNCRQRLQLIALIVLPTFILDQLSKLAAAELLPRSEMFSYAFDTVRIGYAENIGAFLGLGNSLSPSLRFWIFIVAVGAVLTALLTYLLYSHKQDKFDSISLSLVLSGGLSNFYDRVMNNGAVIDFINLGIGSLRTGIFNIADVFIMLGLVLIIAKPLFTVKLLSSEKATE